MPFWNFASAPKPYSGQYGANLYLIQYAHTSTPPPIKLAAVQAPSSTYMFLDAGVYAMNAGQVLRATLGDTGSNQYLPGAGDVGTSSCEQPDSFYQSDCQSGRHFGGVNVTFADGHVKWLRSSVVIAEMKKPAPDTRGAWNPANS